MLAAFSFRAGAQSQPVDCSRRTAQDYVPITRQDREAEYIRSLVYPEAFLFAGTVAGVEQAADWPTETGQGGRAYARRGASAQPAGEHRHRRASEVNPAGPVA